MKKIYILICIATIALYSCKSPQKISNESSYYSFETTLLTKTHDGSCTVRAFGQGMNRATAVEQARKNAVHGIIFRGIHGSDGINILPLIKTPNAEEKYKLYFGKFFSTGGEYTNYSTLSPEKINSRIKSKGNAQTMYGVIVNIDINRLEQKLINDGIINN